MARRNASLAEKQAKFVRQVSDLLNRLDERKSSLTERLEDRIGKLRDKVEEQQNTVVPRLQETMDRLDEQREQATPLVRKAVTGHEELSVTEWLNKYKVVKLFDKMTFVGGIFFMQATQYVATVWPEYFRFYFAVLSLCLMTYRWYQYRRDHMHYFLLDYCYLTNALCILNALVLPRSRFLWQMNFVASHGPLMWAIVAWRNSLVFHSADKVVSIFIHVVPAIMTYTERWRPNSPMCASNASCDMDPRTAFAAPMAVFILWQLSYLLITEVLRRYRFEQNPQLMTSLRWIARDKKNLIHQLMLRFGRETHLLGPDEELDMNKKPALIISTFVAFQTVYTLATFVPTWLFFKNQLLNRLFIIYIGLMSCWNGANFYFEVFAKRYEAGLQKKREQEAAAREKKEKRRSSRRSSKRQSSSVRAKGFCALPNEAERALLEEEAAELQQPDAEPQGEEDSRPPAPSL